MPQSRVDQERDPEWVVRLSAGSTPSEDARPARPSLAMAAPRSGALIPSESKSAISEVDTEVVPKARAGASCWRRQHVVPVHNGELADQRDVSIVSPPLGD
jgi:hypothetical protein